MEIINRIAQDHPILVDKYLQGKELEVDAVCDGHRYPDSGNHGAYSTGRRAIPETVFPYTPAQTISEGVKATIAEYTRKAGEIPSRNRPD